MDIINEIFGEIKREIIYTIQLPQNLTPYMATRQLAVNYSFDPSTARLLLKGIEEIFSIYKKG